jgi:apolipoprotein N-acyltransferase
MENIALHKPARLRKASLRYGFLLRPLIAGLLLPFGFSPFHLPGLAILGIALLYAQLKDQTPKQAFLTGFVFGLGFLGLGVSWIYVSIHEYGHLNIVLSSFITLLFIFYLAIFPALVAILYNRLSIKCSLLSSCVLFSALWCLGEYLRATVASGFPWLLLGFGQLDTPLKYLLPLVGVYGVSFLTCLAATCLATTVQTTKLRRYLWLTAFVGLLLAPSVLKYKQWTKSDTAPISIGIIQSNLSMRDKWDESLFWQLVQQYKNNIEQLIGKKDLIVLPESAIPVPENYVTDFLDTIDFEAKQHNTTVLLGIPQSASLDESSYYNTIIALGSGEGHYIKQHIVPFGEYIPKPFQRIINWLEVPISNLKPGRSNQSLIHVSNHPIAALICYELAYPQLLRNQLPDAEWIVSVSDDGWFGHSLAMYQHLQMAQVLSMQTGRYQVVSNNDGLSSIIDTQGQIVNSLPAFSNGILESTIYPSSGASPWVYYGDMPILLMCLFLIFLTQWKSRRKAL